ncbi:hypothetical protein BDN70DRAFT_872444 [Pholiota conissans]|uniref:SWIM-type domain-containing protein n=1 Tax=Pholiota conissans TaxID=109636 RepID=A0A9P6D699_9AGAR|nr:hypothetical protein BDN70DRAFT_872444 [Pholiota conissans]
MSLDNFIDLVISIVESIEPSDNLSESDLSKFQAVSSEGMILAALDIIDHGKVIRYTTPWGHSEYEIMGSTETNTVFLDIRNSKIPYSCSCPAFVSSVLISDTHVMCKHVLATMIASKLKLCIGRPTTPDDLVALYNRNFTLVDKQPYAE